MYHISIHTLFYGVFNECVSKPNVGLLVYVL